MKFEHFLGTDTCDTSVGIKKILSKQNQNGYNEFWISNDDSFPFMAVLTKDQKAYVHFFDEEGSPGLRGIADYDISEQNGTDIFYSNNGSEQIYVENCCVIPLDKAIAVIEEFFLTNKLPHIIHWDPLWEESE